MRTVFVHLVIVTALLLGSCSSVTVRHDFDPEYDFSQFKTYRWASSKELNPNDELARNPLVLKRVQASVDRVLATKGLTKIESGEPDLVVVAHAGVKERMQVYQTGLRGGYYGGWYDPWWGAYGGTTHVSYYEEGTLVIDLVSWKNKELAWRGMGTKVLEDYKDSEKQQKAIDEIVNRILAAYPPKSK